MGPGPDGKRYVVMQPMISKGYRYQAKDRHNRLTPLGKNGVIDLAGENGYPDTAIARVVCGLGSGQ